MTNKELITIFELVESNSENIFDIYDKLSNYAEAYKEMPIAQIKSTIYDAYELYCNHKNKSAEILHAILNADFSSIVEQFDLEKLFNSIPEEYKDLFIQLIEDANN